MVNRKLVEMLKAMPPHPCSIELPNVDNVRIYGPRGHAQMCLVAAKALFAKNGL